MEACRLCPTKAAWQGIKGEISVAKRADENNSDHPASDAGGALSTRGLRVIRRQTLKERIYQELRKALQEGKFEPGESITVKLLEQELGGGTMPIRETIQRLAAEGALINLPTGRVKVPLFTADEFDEIKEIRLRLEGLAARNAAIRLSDEDFARIELSHQRLMSVATGNTEWGEIVHLNYVFHFAIYEAARSPHLLSMIDSLWLRVSPLLSIPFKKPAKVRAEWVLGHEHNQLRLLDALKQRDGKAAEAVIREIILGSAAWYHRHHQFAAEPL
jgi:DNA-binding GntR family transcriptional regulator